MALPELRDADLSGANLEGVDPSGVNLDGVNLSNANLRGAKLRDAKVSSTTNVRRAIYDEHTQRYWKFKHEESGAVKIETKASDK